MLLRELSKRHLNADGQGASASSLGSLFQCLIILTVEKQFLMPGLNLPSCSFVSFPCILSLGSRKKRLAPPSLLSLLQRAKRLPICLLQTGHPKCPQPHRICFPAWKACLLTLLPSSGCFQVPYHPFCIAEVTIFEVKLHKF